MVSRILRFSTGLAFVPVRRLPYLNGFPVASVTSGNSVGTMRSFSSKNDDDKNKCSDPIHVAKAILGRFPGYTAEAKSCSAMVLTSLAAIAISKEVFILNHTSMEVISYIIATVIWYKFAGSDLRNFTNSKKMEVINFLEGIKQQHKEYFRTRVEENKRICELPSIVTKIHEMGRDMVKMESEISRMKQEKELYNAVKAWLDSQVAHEASVRGMIQSSIHSSISKFIEDSLSKASLQDEILKNSISNMENLSKQSSA